ncbi:unnamed protein product, partial [Phaeothamnion confervicola]
QGKQAKALELTTRTAPLGDQPPVVMQRPLVIVPGWKSTPDKFDALTHKLLESGQNGSQVCYVKDGKFFGDGECTQTLDKPDSSNKIFQLVFGNIHQSPDETAPQIAQSVEAIRKLTGTSQVDALGYSMGGLATRLFLSQEAAAGSKTPPVNRLMLLGTPNHGTKFSDLARHAVQRDIQWAMSMGGMAPIDL